MYKIKEEIYHGVHGELATEVARREKKFSN